MIAAASLAVLLSALADGLRVGAVRFPARIGGLGRLLLTIFLWGVAASSVPAEALHAQPQATDLQPKIFLPLIGQASETPDCPIRSTARYNSIPVLPPPTDRPAAAHADLNLALRGYVATSAYLGLVDYNGTADPAAPKIPGMFSDGRKPTFTASFRVRDWNWACGGPGCVGDPLADPEVTLLEMATARGEGIAIPSRSAEIYGGGYQALVLYAEEQRITLKYTREDNVVRGYTVHLENLCVNPELLSLYRSLDASGRGKLPALRNGEDLGTAVGNAIGVAVRDTGSFQDPRSRKDWW